jgi:hypothetical protein
MIRYRRTLEQIAVLAHAGQHNDLSANKVLQLFVMIEQLARTRRYIIQASPDWPALPRAARSGNLLCSRSFRKP